MNISPEKFLVSRFGREGSRPSKFLATNLHRFSQIGFDHPREFVKSVAKALSFRVNNG
jgi:hypothetical protein